MPNSFDNIQNVYSEQYIYICSKNSKTSFLFRVIFPRRKECMFIKEIYEDVHKSFIPKNQKTRNNPNIYQQENWSVNCGTFLQWETIQLQEVVAV